MPRVTLKHPYLDHEPGQPLSVCTIGDALNNVSAALAMLSDLFVGPTDKCEILNTDQARVGMFNQLMALANTLEVLSDRIGTDPIND